MKKIKRFDLFLLIGILFSLIFAATAFAEEDTIDISRAVVTADDWVYNGKEASPDVTVTLDGTILSSWTDYDYDFRPHSAVEVGTVDIIVEGTGNYSGEAHGSFRILPLDISDTFITVNDQWLESNGEPQEPDVSVKLDYKTWLSEGEDYIVTYTNNINPGTGTVTINGIGHYSGTVSVNFTIRPMSYGFYVGGIEVTAGNAADILGDGRVFYDASTRTLYLKNANVTGTYSVSLGSGAYAHYSGKSYYSIYADGTLKIDLSGENTLGGSLKGGNVSITGNGKLSIPGTTGGTAGECVGVECDTLVISPESSLSIKSSGSPYSNLGIKVNNKLIVRGGMDINVPVGAPAKGISGPEEIDVSGKLQVIVKSAYTNWSYGISANKINITGSVTVDSAKTKKDTGIKCSKMTISNTGSLIVNAYTSAVSASSIQLGNKLVLFAGTSPGNAYYYKNSGDALANNYVSISANNKVPAAQQETNTSKEQDKKAKTDSKKDDSKTASSATIKASKTKVKFKKKTTIKITSNSGAKLTVKGKNSKAKNKKYVKITSGKNAKIVFYKKAAKGTYKFTVTSAAKGNYKKTTKTIRIVVK